MTVAVLDAVRIGPEGLPERTLGWQALQWSADYLKQPDGPNADAPWRFTPEQARHLLWFYAIDERGRFLYRRSVLRRMKGWGKDPFASAVAAIEFVGPCRFGGWDADGQPVAVPHSAAWVQVAAVSREQTRNTMTLFPGLFTPRAIEEYGIDLGKEIIYAHRGRCRIESVTSSPRALEGGRPTFVIKNEIQHWLQSNDGIAMADVIDRNADKSRDGSTRSMAIQNAHAPGEGSDAEREWESYLANPDGVLFDSLEATPDVVKALRLLKDGDPKQFETDPGLRARLIAQVEEGLVAVRGDSDWLDVPRLLAGILDAKTATNTALRYYLNVAAAAEERAFDGARWDALAEPKTVPDGALITLGFDGSKSRDHTALIGTEIATGYQWVVGYWEPRLWDDGDIHVDVAAVEAAVEAAFERYEVWRLNADPFYWQDSLTRWQGRYGDAVVSYDTRLYRRMAVALYDYATAINAGELSHDGDERLASNIKNAHKNLQGFTDDQGERMWIIEKERPDSPLKIDAAMAACLSWEARRQGVAKGLLEAEDTSSVYETRGLRRL